MILRTLLSHRRRTHNIGQASARETYGNTMRFIKHTLGAGLAAAAVAFAPSAHANPATRCRAPRVTVHASVWTSATTSPVITGGGAIHLPTDASGHAKSKIVHPLGSFNKVSRE